MALLFNTLSAAEDARPVAKISRGQFLQDLDGAFVTEMGSYGTRTGNDAELGRYILDHWPTLLGQLDELPAPGGNRTLLVGLIGAAAEDLPPEDYLDFMEKYMDLAEQGKISANLVGRQVLGVARKHPFFQVNWQNPRVKAILDRALTFFPDEGESTHEVLADMKAGKLEESYSTGAADELPPETLPGIRLHPPDESFLARLEKAMGRKSREEPRTAGKLNSGSSNDSGSSRSQAQTAPSGWLAGGALALLSAALIAIFRARREKRTS